MVEHYEWVTTGQIPPSFINRELVPQAEGEDQTAAADGPTTDYTWGGPRRRSPNRGRPTHKHEGGGATRTRNKAEKYKIKRWLKAHGLMPAFVLKFLLCVSIP